MSLADVVERVKSGVLNINFLDNSNKPIAKGSGFMSHGYLITNNHVFQGPQSAQVWIRNESDSSTDLGQGLLLSYEDFKNSLLSGSDVTNHDYAILDLPTLRNRGLHDFEIMAPATLRIGDDVALLGFPLDHMNLTCHSGIVSSFYSNNNVDIIQLDASVNASNSGGPLISRETGHVLGIITRKATGLTNMFAQLRTTIQSNIQLVQQAQGGGGVFISGVNPLQAIEASQGQMLGLLGEIERSANVGIGYAFSAKHILEDNVLHSQ